MEVFKIKSSNAGWTEADADNFDLSHSQAIPWVGGVILAALSTGTGSALAVDGIEGAGGLAALDSHDWGALGGSGTNGNGKTFIDFTIPGSVIQDWIDNPSGNGGLLIRDTNESTLASRSESFFTIYSSEFSVTEERPLLIFETPEPSSLVLAVLGLAALLLCQWRSRKGKT